MSDTHGNDDNQVDAMRVNEDRDSHERWLEMMEREFGPMKTFHDMTFTDGRATAFAEFERGYFVRLIRVDKEGKEAIITFVFTREVMYGISCMYAAGRERDTVLKDEDALLNHLADSERGRWFELLERTEGIPSDVSNEIEPPATEVIAGTFEVGANERGEVIINFPPEMIADFSLTEGGHIGFSPNQARHLANLLLKHAFNL